MTSDSNRRNALFLLVGLGIPIAGAVAVAGMMSSVTSGIVGAAGGSVAGLTVLQPAVMTNCVDSTGELTIADAGAGGWVIPLGSAYQVTSEFGPRNAPKAGASTVHQGLDLAATGSNAPILAAANGIVKTAGVSGGYGNLVVIDHGSGMTTRYGHMSSIAVTAGQRVTAGQKIGTEGSTGVSTGPHLHFEVRKNGIATNPRPFLTGQKVALDGQAASTAAIAAASKPAASASSAPATPAASPSTSSGTATPTGAPEGTFQLPAPGEPRQDSLHNKPLTIPPDIQQLYQQAGQKYGLPWTLLAGIGMEETGHGRNKNTSSAGARGAMQFMPGTWATQGVDGDGDGRADILNPADSIHSAANYLTNSGAKEGDQGVRKALFAYNHAQWYVNDVLYYAQQYGGGNVVAAPGDCPPSVGGTTPPVADATVAGYLAWAHTQAGKPYVMGANGPDAWDCSGFIVHALKMAGLNPPRSAAAIEKWCAAGNCTPIPSGQEKAGDLIFWDSYLGPNTVGHAVIVWDPVAKKTIEAQGTRTGVGHFSYDGKDRRKTIYKIYRPGKGAAA